jgi:hypothetical protein
VFPRHPHFCAEFFPARSDDGDPSEAQREFADAQMFLQHQGKRE